MKKLITFIACGFLISTANAQFNQDWGFRLGIATHMGDIAKGSGGTGASAANPTLGGFYRYKFSSLISARAELNWVRLSGDDAVSVEPSRIARNLSFRTDIFELAAIGEIHLIDIRDFGGTGRYNTFFNVYGFLGIGAIYFSPTAVTDDGERVKLAELDTEGEDYSQMTYVVPFGIGSHMTFNRKWRLGVEIGARYTGTDYLDDVHDRYMTDEEVAAIDDPIRVEMQNRSNQDYIDNSGHFAEGYKMGDGGIRGGPDVNDWFFTGTVSVSWIIRGKSNFYRARYNFSRGRKHKKRRARAKF